MTSGSESEAAPAPKRPSPRNLLIGIVLLALIAVVVLVFVLRGDNSSGPSAAALPAAALGDWMLEGVATDGKQRPKKPVVTFNADGTWTGSDGCNALSGAWTIEGDGIKTTVGPSTLIACDNVPYGAIFFNSTATIAEDKMTVQYDQAGTPATAVLVR